MSLRSPAEDENASPPNVLIGGPVPNSPGFPLKACGNDETESGPSWLLAKGGKSGVVPQDAQRQPQFSKEGHEEHEGC